MALAWAWGWEIGAEVGLYNGDWACSSTSTAQIDTANTDTTRQPTDGYGGGSYCLKIERDETIASPVIFGDGEVTKGACTWTFKNPAGAEFGDGYYFGALFNTNGHILFGVRMQDDNVTSDSIELYALDNLEQLDLIVTSTTQVGLDEWHRVTIRWDSSTTPPTGYLYIDGNLEGSGQPSGNPDTGTTPCVVRWAAACWYNNDYTYHDHTYIHTDTDNDNFTEELFIQGLKLTGDDQDGTWARSDNDSQTNLYQNLTGSTNDVYVTSSDYPASNLFTLQDRSAINASWNPTIRGVNVIAMMSGSGEIDVGASVMNLSANTVTGSTDILDSTLRFVTGSFRTTDPAGATWTGSNLDSLKIGVYVTGTV